jgi:hypothetical protein
VKKEDKKALTSTAWGNNQYSIADTRTKFVLIVFRLIETTESTG